MSQLPTSKAQRTRFNPAYVVDLLNTFEHCYMEIFALNKMLFRVDRLTDRLDNAFWLFSLDHKQN